MNTSTVVAHPEPGLVDRLFRIGIWIFSLSIFFSLAGTLLLNVFPSLMGFFGPVYPTLVKGPTWTYMFLLPILPCLMYGRSLGWAMMTLLVLWGSLIGGMSELIGTTTGFPFGEYAYTDWLGAKIMDHVPYFIPPSWFALSIICVDLARRISDSRLQRILLASLFMVLWDVSLDPAMSKAFPFWIYPEDGFFYGMPASNWLGWFVVSFVICWGFEVFLGDRDLQHHWAPLFFALNCIFPFLLSLLYGLYLGFFIGLIATAIPLLAVYTRTGSLTT